MLIAFIWKIAEIISVLIFLVIFVLHILLPKAKYIRTRDGIREEFDKPPPLDN